MNNKYIIVIIAVIVVLVIAGYLFFIGNNQVNQGLYTNESGNQQQVQQQTNTTTEGNTTQTGKMYEVIYTDSGYSPSEITIKLGDTVVFKNQSSGGMWTASGMHPTHTLYSGTSLDQHCPDQQNISFDECTSVNSGGSWSFTFEKAGTWAYHNHLKINYFGKIIVE